MYDLAKLPIVNGLMHNAIGLMTGWTHWWNDYRGGENPLEDNVPAWYFTHQPERFDLKAINQKLAKLYQIKGGSGFWETQGCYDELEGDFEEP